MARNKVFISYSRAERAYLEALLPVLQAVPSIGEVLWCDAQGIDIGDEFHANIQQALAEAGVGILLLSNRFFTRTLPNMSYRICCNRPSAGRSSWAACMSLPFLMPPSKSA